MATDSNKKSSSSSSKSRSGGKSSSGSASSSSRSSSSRSSGSRSSSNRKSSSKNNGSLSPIELARAARSQLGELTGRPPESVLGLHKEDDGWKVTIELVELSRVPNSTDLLGAYMVTLDDDGQLISYERVGRYQRGQAGGNEQ